MLYLTNWACESDLLALCTVVCSEMIPNCETCLLNERTMTFICTACSSSEYRLRNGECTPIGKTGMYVYILTLHVIKSSLVWGAPCTVLN